MSRPPLRSRMSCSARSMAPAWSQWPWLSTMASTGARSTPSRETFCSKVRSSGPVSNSTLRTLSPARIVSRQERPCAAHHRQAPPSTQAAPRRRPRPAISVSTNEGTDESESVTLSTRIWISTESTGFSVLMTATIAFGDRAAKPSKSQGSSPDGGERWHDQRSKQFIGCFRGERGSARDQPVQHQNEGRGDVADDEVRRELARRPPRPVKFFFDSACDQIGKHFSKMIMEDGSAACPHPRAADVPVLLLV